MAMTKTTAFDSDDIDTARDIFYVLTEQDDLTGHRSAKLLALLCQRLVDTGKISQQDLDALVSEALR